MEGMAEFGCTANARGLVTSAGAHPGRGLHALNRLCTHVYFLRLTQSCCGEGSCRGQSSVRKSKSRCWRLRLLLCLRSSLEQTKTLEKSSERSNGHGLGSEAGVAGFRAGVKGVMVYRCCQALLLTLIVSDHIVWCVFSQAIERSSWTYV
jgi:hypothetical protein